MRRRIHWCCEAPLNREGVQKVSVLSPPLLVARTGEDRMRQEQQVSVSLVFRRDRVGVMRMTLVRGDI